MAKKKILDKVIATKWPRTLGAPYQGSKSQIAKWIVDQLPSQDYFVDLFGGGGAMAKAAMISGKYPKGVITNDFDGSGLRLFRDGMDGKYRDYDRFVTRDEFFNGGATPEEKLLFSYGNDGRTYAYGRVIEPVKKGIHEVIVPNDYDQAMRACYELRGKIPGFKKSMCNDIVSAMDGKDLNGRRLAFQNMMAKQGFKERYYRPQHLERVDRVNSLQNIPNKDRFKFYNTSYEDVHIPENSLIYADPPYRGTKEYVANGFDSAKFDDWLRSNPQRVYISEYNMPDDFKIINSIEKSALMGNYNSKKVIENLYTNGK